MNSDLLYQIALTLIPHIGTVQAKALLQHYQVDDIFKLTKNTLEKIEGIGLIRAASIKEFSDFARVEQEIAFIEKHKIRTLFITHDDYPKRLLHCNDSPILLYFRGVTDLNASRILAVIGTRNHTEYGKQFVEKLVNDLATYNVTIVSGLAYGIDAIAHRSAMKNTLPTVGVLAHGLDQLYPLEHRRLAKDMISQEGGLLTEFLSGTKPDKHNFPIRNRIVAGMSDATIVIETGLKGGSMITAELANGYNRDVFAVPGRATDIKSAGCNNLIRNNKAVLLTDASELVDLMNWDQQSTRIAHQKQLFIELSENEKAVINILHVNDPVHIDEINFKSGLSTSSVAAAILNLELENVVLSLPGKLYRLA